MGGNWNEILVKFVGYISIEGNPDLLLNNRMATQNSQKWRNLRQPTWLWVPLFATNICYTIIFQQSFFKLIIDFGKDFTQTREIGRVNFSESQGNHKISAELLYLTYELGGSGTIWE